MNIEEFHNLALDLEHLHGIFAKLWALGRPVEDNSIPTAAVGFNSEGHCIDFAINPQFWSTCSDYKKKFIIAHECLHVILNHGIRARNLPQGSEQIANMAMDISINHMLVKNFGFIRELIKDADKFCWIDTVFKDKAVNIKPDMHFEYYYNELMKDIPNIPNNLILVDDHTRLGDIPQDIQEKVHHEIEKFSSEEKQNISEMLKAEDNNMRSDKSGDVPGGLHAGSLGGSIIKRLNIKHVVKKKKWETVIKKWANKYLKNSQKDIDQWARTNRRFTMLDSHFFLPTEMEMDAKNNEKHRIKVWFFLDTSGSCAHLSERFFKAAKSLPTDRFDIDLYCFDTRVYKTSLKTQELYGFGGTSFTCIDRYIENHCKKDSDYPKAVFIITDGYGDDVHPRYPRKWYWFLSENCRDCIPEECNIYDLKNFE